MSNPKTRRVWFSFCATRPAAFLDIKVRHSIHFVDTTDFDDKSLRLELTKKITEQFSPSNGWSNHNVLLVKSEDIEP